MVLEHGKKMKKLLAFLLSFLMLFTLTACEEEEVDLALDIAISVLEELEKYEESQSDVLPEYEGEYHVPGNSRFPVHIFHSRNGYS